VERSLSPAPDQASTQRTSLLRDYLPSAGHYDEIAAVEDGRRQLRPHWRTFVGMLAALGLDHLDALAGELSRRVRENGVTYNVYDEAEGAERPWNLDLLPLVLPQSEWTGLAADIEQRARLANAMVGDLYGARRLVREGLLPPALVYGHPGYLRACHGINPPGGVHLHVVAFDLARDPAGRWCVVSQRTQAPSGTGYALENRLLCSQLFPDAFRSHHVRRLSGFFGTLQNTLLGLAPAGQERPYIALLTPGPHNETYFEHAYLARYLGHALVQGADLTVREDRLYLKTVEGLQRVHVLMRRLDDEFCDPLELRSDSQIGVPGLMQAVRAGTVVMANALGSAPLESPAITAFLPAICRALFGEELRLPSVESWWLGEEAAAAIALPKLKDLIVKPANPRLRFEPVFGSRLDAAGIGEWQERLRAQPQDYVLQGLVPLSYVTGWDDGRVVPCELMLRAFAVSDGRGGYAVMPGGLTRVAPPGREAVSIQRGGGAKDTWIVGPETAPPASLLPGRVTPAGLQRASGNLPSRVGESLYWLGRYGERSENAARLSRTVITRLAEAEPMPADLSAMLARICVRNGLLPASGATEPVSEEVLWRSLRTSLTDAHGAQGLAYAVARTHQCAAGLRERLGEDHWRFLQRLHQSVERLRGQVMDVGRALDLLDTCILHLAAVAGLHSGYMVRDQGSLLMTAGARVEGVAFLADALAEGIAGGAAGSGALLETMLELGASTLTYRARYLRPPELLPVLDLLVLDERNPLSVSAQLIELRHALGMLPDHAAPEALLEELLVPSEHEQVWLDLLAGESEAVQMIAMLRGLVEQMAELSDAVTAAWFAQTQDLDMSMVTE